MAHSNPSDQELRELLTNATTIAIVGALMDACIGATHSLLRIPPKPVRRSP